MERLPQQQTPGRLDLRRHPHSHQPRTGTVNGTMPDKGANKQHDGSGRQRDASDHRRDALHNRERMVKDGQGFARRPLGFQKPAFDQATRMGMSRIDVVVMSHGQLAGRRTLRLGSPSLDKGPFWCPCGTAGRQFSGGVGNSEKSSQPPLWDTQAEDLSKRTPNKG